MNPPDLTALADHGSFSVARSKHPNRRPALSGVPPESRLPGYFIDHGGHVEDDPLDGGGLSESEAIARLRRVVSETGQLVVRAPDGMMTAWFAGIGDPADLFFELRPREAWSDRDELVMGVLCSLSDAERVLRNLYGGAAES